MGNVNVYGVEAEEIIQPVIEEGNEDLIDEDIEPEEAQEEEEILLEDNEEEKAFSQEHIDSIIKKRTSELSKKRNEAQERAEKAEKKLKELEKLVKKSMPDFIPEGEDTEKVLRKMAAENEGVSVEELEKRIADEDLISEYKLSKEAERVRAIKEKDLNSIKALYPIEVKAIEEIPNYGTFSRLMMTGQFTAVEAFKLANPTSAKAETEYARQKALNESKSHIRATNTRTVSTALKPIPASEYDNYKAAYPKATEKELLQIYKKSKEL